MRLIVLVFACLAAGCTSAQNSADSVLNFIAANRSRAALYLVTNDTVTARLNENKMMPLASTVKLLVAVEFAKQGAQKLFDPAARVPVGELNRYYLPNTDGDAHPAWLAYAKENKLVQSDSVSLLEVARGMMIFSSNANTEYLMELLGLDNIKGNTEMLGMKKHTAIFPLVASLFMYQNPQKKKEDKILSSIRDLSEEQYSRFIYDMHKALAYDTLLLKKFRPQDLSMKMQKLWSDRLPASTVSDYARLCSILNNRKFFDENTCGLIAETVETLMENPANRAWLKHAGMKGGSTAWVLTKAAYATTRKGVRVELVYFFNDLTPAENDRLQQWLNEFEIACFSNEKFRKKAAEKLK